MLYMFAENQVNYIGLDFVKNTSNIPENILDIILKIKNLTYANYTENIKIERYQSEMHYKRWVFMNMNSFLTDSSQKGGKLNNTYYNKYIKYKLKYLNLKKSIK
jgi:hypothetical protein